MIIFITSQGDSKNSKPNPHFGRTPMFIKYNLEDDTSEPLINDAASEPGGAGVAAAQLLIDHHAAAVVSGSFGPNAYRSLNAAGIKMFTFNRDYDTVNEVVEAYKNGALKPVDKPEIRK